MSNAPRATHWVAVGLVVAYLILGSGYALLMPPWETPDAPSHYLYVRYVASEHTLPLPRDVLETGYVYPATLYEWHHPPLYYVIQSWAMNLTGGTSVLISDPEFVLSPTFSFSAPSSRYQVPLWPWWAAHPSYTAMLRLRFLNMALFGLPVVLLVYGIGVRTFNDPGAGAVLAVAATMLPQSLYLHVNVQNDIAAVLWATAIWLIIISTTLDRVTLRWYHVLAAGLCASLGMVSKINAFPVAMVAGVWALVHGRQAVVDGRQLGSVKALLLFGIPCFVVCLLYFIGGYEHAVAFLDVLMRGVAVDASTPMPVGAFTKTLIASFWGRLGWMNVPLSPLFIVVLSVLAGAGLIGSVALFIFRRSPFDHSIHRRTFLWLLFGLGFQLCIVYIVFLPMRQPQGRFFFPALVPFWLVVLWPVLSRKRSARLWGAGAVVMLTLVYNALTWYRLYQVYWIG